MVDQRFPTALRLTSRTDFRRVYDRRCWVGDDWVRIAGQLSELPHPRLGLSVSRAIGGAVIRNRWKRLLREAFRTSRARLPEGIDLVVVPRERTDAELGVLQESLVELSWKLVMRLKRARAVERRNKRDEGDSRRGK